MLSHQLSLTSLTVVINGTSFDSCCNLALAVSISEENAHSNELVTSNELSVWCVPVGISCATYDPVDSGHSNWHFS